MSFHFFIFKYFNYHYRSIWMITSFEKSFFSFYYRFLAAVCCGLVHSTNFSFSVLCFHSILFTFAHGSIANMICFWILQVLSSWRVGIPFAFLMAHEYLIIKLNWLTSIIIGILRHLSVMKYTAIFLTISTRERQLPVLWQIRNPGLWKTSVSTPIPYALFRWEKNPKAIIFES